MRRSPPPNSAGGAVLTIDGRSAARAVFVGCLALEVAFVLLDYHVNYGRLTDIGAIRRLTNIAREDGLASWFASTQSLLVGLTAWLFWMSVRARGADWWRQAGWLLVAALFTYMAVDDGVQLHERIGTAFNALREQGSSLSPSFEWQPLFLPLFGLLGAGAGLFLWSELRAWCARGLVVFAFMLFGMAVGLDFLEGLDPDHPWNLYTAAVNRYDVSEFTRARFSQSPYETVLHFSRSIEESFEMLANTCFWAAILGHIDAVMGNLTMRPRHADSQAR